MPEIESRLDSALETALSANPHYRSGNEIFVEFGNAISGLVRDHREEVSQALAKWLRSDDSMRVGVAMYAASEYQLREMAPAARARFDDDLSKLAGFEQGAQDLERLNLESDVSSLARLLDELEDERIGRSRVALREAYAAVPAGRFRAPGPPGRARANGPGWSELRYAFEQFEWYRKRILRPAGEMLGGKSLDRTEMNPDRELRAAFAALTESADMELAGLARAYLAEYDAVERLAEVAREMPLDTL